MSPLYEYYVSFPRPDGRQGHGYGQVGGKAKKASPSVGTPLQKQSLYPYVSPEESEFHMDADEVEIEDVPADISKKILAKIGGPVHYNDPFASNWVDRGAFVNWATRLDLYENKYFSIKDMDRKSDAFYNLGGISQLYAMGNGAGIYKTKPGKTIGMSWAGRPQSYSAKKTAKKIPPSLVAFIKDYIAQDDNEI